MSTTDEQRVWQSPLAGHWYPAAADALRETVAALVPHPAPARVADVHAVIVPHAGYVYSGRVAMAAYARLDADAYDRVVVIGPSHAVALRNRLSALHVDRMRTPLGDCVVDRAWLQPLRDTSFVIEEPQAHVREHSDQIQLPLLQHFFGDRPWRIAPLVCGRFDAPAAAEFGATLRKALDARTLLVISTDFTHYGPAFDYRPFVDRVPERLHDLDHRVFERVAARDAEGFRRVLEETGATVCGAHALSLLIATVGAQAIISEVAYEQSGRLTGDWENSVSYLSALVTG